MADTGDDECGELVAPANELHWFLEGGADSGIAGRGAIGLGDESGHERDAHVLTIRGQLLDDLECVAIAEVAVDQELSATGGTLGEIVYLGGVDDCDVAAGGDVIEQNFDEASVGQFVVDDDDVREVSQRVCSSSGSETRMRPSCSSGELPSRLREISPQARRSMGPPA